MSAPSVLDRLERLLHREHHAILLDHRDLMTLPIGERVERGETLAGLRFVREDSSGRIVVACAENLSKHRAGDALRLGNADPLEAGPGLAVVYTGYDDRTGEILLERDRFRSGGGFDPRAPLQLDPEAQSLIGLGLEALALVRAPRGRGPQVRALLSGTGRLESDPAAALAASEIAAGLAPALDASQHEAFVAALSSTPAALIQGPPGTGKTHVLARIAAALARRGLRVLVTAYTHRAVNNALRKVGEAGPDLSVVKAGKPSAADDLRGTSVATIASLRRLPSASELPRVVGATLFGSRVAWDADLFDAVLIDEAAQVPLAFAAGALLAAPRAILVGDHRQLGPILRGRHDDPLASASVFEHLVSSFPPVLLRTTYRMNAGINAFPSRVFYGGRLAPSDAAASARFSAVPGGPFDDLFDPDRPAVLALVGHEGFRTRSGPEADLVAALVVDRLVRQGGDPRELAVVSPYRAQLRAIRTRVRRGLAAADRAGALPVIDTVERMQGQERDLVIVSLAASDPEHLAGEAAAFFYAPRRLNVTITRARTKLIVVASPRAFEAFPRDLGGLADADRFRRLARELPAIDVTGRAGGAA